MKTIRGKLILLISSILLVACLTIGGVSCVLSYKATSDTLNKTMIETSEIAASQITESLSLYMEQTENIGCIARLANSATTSSDMKTILDERIKMYNMKTIQISDMSGNTKDGENIASQQIFSAALKGETAISNLTVEQDGSTTISVAAPLWKGGLFETEVVGAVYSTFDGDILVDIVSGISVGETGSAYIVDKEGTTIAHKNTELIKNKDNDIKNAQTNKKLANLGEITKKMAAGESGIGEYKYNGVNKVVTYAPIKKSDGWSIGVNVEKNEFLKAIITAMITVIILSIIILIAGIAFGGYTAFKIGQRITSCAKRLQLLSQGDISTPVPQTHSKDETKILVDATTETVLRLQMVVTDITYILGEMAKKNFNVKLEQEYAGDFVPVHSAMNEILKSLNSVMSQINQSSSQVSSGADQVASGAQGLSQGATEQASSVQELSASIVDISSQVKDNAQNSSDVNLAVKKVGEELNDSHEQMKTMISAITEISQTSTEISKIIKTIDDIAFQTNILALNAAVEAARAGAAGKGFAVVAEEVRNLAGKSAEAAKNTTELIKSSIAAVQKGTEIANETANSLEGIVVGANNIVCLIGNISDASSSQATAISQVTQGVEQISSVVQNNSATAEESAAASEELSGQAEILARLVAEFTLAEETYDSPIAKKEVDKKPSSKIITNTFQSSKPKPKPPVSNPPPAYNPPPIKKLPPQNINQTQPLKLVEKPIAPKTKPIPPSAKPQSEKPQVAKPQAPKPPSAKTQPYNPPPIPKLPDPPKEEQQANPPRKPAYIPRSTDKY